MASIKPFIKNDFVKSDGRANIKIRVCHQGETRFISTDWNIDPKYMKADGTIDDSYPNANKLNMALNQLQNEYYEIIDGLGLELKVTNINTLSSRLKNKDLVTSFLLFSEARIKELREEGRHSYADSYEMTLTHLSNFSSKVAFSDINVEFLLKFELALKIKGQKVNTRRIYLNNIRAIFNTAIERNLITLDNPFKKFKVKQEKSVKRSFDVNEIRRLMSGTYSVSQQQSVDLFMLILYLNGINLKDLLYITPDKVYKDRIQINRAKTGTQLNVKIFPEALRIIEKYKGNKYLLNILDEDDSYENYKVVLKKINASLKIAFGSNISTYYARHP